MSLYYENLIKTVLENSESNNWQDAVLEWEVYDCVEDDECSTICICGKEGLKYAFTIRNRYNGRLLYPIGSTCIQKFGVDKLYEDASVWEQEFELYDAVSKKRFISLKDGLFSRKLLRKLYEEGAFVETYYNGFNSHNDYQFMLDMFNKRSLLTDSQEAKCSAIILNSIMPYIKQKLKK